MAGFVLRGELDRAVAGFVERELVLGRVRRVAERVAVDGRIVDLPVAMAEVVVGVGANRAEAERLARRARDLERTRLVAIAMGRTALRVLDMHDPGGGRSDPPHFVSRDELDLVGGRLVEPELALGECRRLAEGLPGHAVAVHGPVPVVEVVVGVGAPRPDREGFPGPARLLGVGGRVPRAFRGTRGRGR